jgi:hypothetical protein
MSSDGKKILIAIKDGTRSRCEIYDLNTNQYQATPLDHPLAWDPSGRYLAGLKRKTCIIYDIETSSVLDLGLRFPAGFELLSVQWR